MAKHDKRSSFLKTFIVGSTTGIITKTASAPIERVKILLQTQDEIVKAGRLSKPYKGAIDCVLRTYRNEGVLSFWRGNLIVCLGYLPGQVLTFTLHNKVKHLLNFKKTDSSLVKFGKNISSGGAAGAVTLSAMYSLDYVRTRLAADVKASANGDQRQFNGIIDCYAKTFKSDGIIGLYRGFAISCVGIIVYRACYFGLYDTLRPILSGDAGIISLFMLGFGVTIMAGLVSYPLDTIRRRMLMRSGEPIKYRSSWDCATQILRNEGFMSLMKGAGVSIVHGIAGAGMLTCFDKVKKVYFQRRAQT